MPLLPRPLAVRPRLVSAILVGLVVAAGFWLVPNGLRWSTRAIVSWDLASGLFLVTTLAGMYGRDPDAIRKRAALEDSGALAILVLSMAATIASLAAVAAELSLAKGGMGGEKMVRVTLAFGTVGLSWLLVQMIFALHYAHDYYGSSGPRGQVRGGLNFPGDEKPDYWDFLHFSLVIGVAFQTADIAFTAKRMRRIGTVHSLTAFVFNTIVLALTINLLASLF